MMARRAVRAESTLGVALGIGVGFWRRGWGGDFHNAFKDRVSWILLAGLLKWGDVQK